MPLNFNVDPYFDDFDPTKNYYRILFKPGYAVQARELTQSQTILQDQVHKFADNIFKQNSPVTGGQLTTNFNVYYIKLQTTYQGSAIDVTQFKGKLIRDVYGIVNARVIAVATPTGSSNAGDPPTLVVSYLSGQPFTDGQTIYDINSNLAAVAITSNSTGQSSVGSIAQGVFYISSSYTNSSNTNCSYGTFVQVNPQTIILDKYDNTPNLRLGLNITETIQDYVGDSSLLDPAIGASNFQAPGADRYQITLSLETRPLTFGDDSGFIELARITNGAVATIVSSSVYNVIDDYFAKRDYETNGDYVVNDFKLTPKANTADSSNASYIMSVSKGLAYVHGYRIENPGPIDLTSYRARTQATQNNNPVFIDYGSFFYVDTVRGANGGWFEPTTYQPIDFHCVTSANINTTTANTYSSTLVSTGYIRGLAFDHNANTADPTANSYVYRMYVSDLLNSSANANVVSATTNSVTFPSYYSSSNAAYVGVNISIVNGTDAGDFRTITAYNGTTKTATVNQNWTVTPDTTSIFNLNFAAGNIQSVANTSTKASYPLSLTATATIDPESKINGVTILENPSSPELVFTVGSPYVANLYSTAYNTQQVWRNVSFSGSGTISGTLTEPTGTIRHLGIPGRTYSAGNGNQFFNQQNYTIIVTNKGSSNLNVGDNVPWTTSGRSITMDGTSTVATLSATDVGGSFTATVIATVFVLNGDDPGRILKKKYLINASKSTINSSNTAIAGTYTFVDDTPQTSTGQIYIQNPGLVFPGTKQSLYVSDVKSLVQIIDTGSPSVTPTVAMLTNPSYDVTNNYNFDNGQRDGYYDHATITLEPGAPQPKGNILVLINYYQHSGGDGFFSVASYGNEQYQQIPNYTAKSGITYALRDCIDFRPTRYNAQTQFVFNYSNSTAAGNNALMPVDNSTFTGNYNYYLGRQDLLVLTKDGSFQIVQGTPSLNPIFPGSPDGSLTLAQLSLKPYTGYLPTEAPAGFVPDLGINKVQHKRYTMQDIAGLENRINNVEYYTALSVLESSAQQLQISDAYGLNRFKNGILVDDFSSYATADTLNSDYGATIDRLNKKMTATQNVSNYKLQSLATAYNFGTLDSTSASNLGYTINKDGNVYYYSLPYTTSNVITQKYASRTTNLNPFAHAIDQGTLTLSPNVDNWVDTTKAPALLITDPNLQVFQANSAAINVLTAGNWQSISGTSYTTTTNTEGHNINPSPYGYVGYSTSTTTTTTQSQQTNVLGNYNNIGNTYALNNGYITDISILPYIRPQQIVVSAQGLLTNSYLNSYFDNTSIDNYIRKTNIIELTVSGDSGTFEAGDIVGYAPSGSVNGGFVPTARVVAVYYYPNSLTMAGTNLYYNRVRLYVAADPYSTVYSNSTTLLNAQFNASGTAVSSTAYGTIFSTNHFGGQIQNTWPTSFGTNQIKLSPLASATDGYYNGNTIYICTGTGIGQSATITNYIAANQVAFLSSSINTANGDIYSIGDFVSDESGSFYGIFNLPAGIFHTGQRTLRIDNGPAGNQSASTTYAEGVFYAEGLQTTQQSVDFGASPAGAKNTFTQVNSKTQINTVTTISPWDPVAQTFIIGNEYPNGTFLSSVKLFFASAPANSNTSTQVTLSIIGTLNGYPNGETLDHSIVVMPASSIIPEVSQNPNYLDPASYVEFVFDVPVYIQPNVLYAFMVQSKSDEYTLWTAASGDNAKPSSVSNIPPSSPKYVEPTTISQISAAPYVGSLFLSQNSKTWTADQNQDLMFVINQCIFDTTQTPNIQFVVPAKLPQRTLIDQQIQYYANANSIFTGTNVNVDAFNITTTDFTPTFTGINYNYNATLASGAAAGLTNITPGKYGTAAADNIYLNDNQGERVLVANSNTSFSLYAQLASLDPYVSPIVSESGLSTYAITWNINNTPLSNSLITVTSGGSGYANGLSLLANGSANVTISAPTGINGTQAYAVANVANGVVTSVYITTPGSGYISTPTITISSATGTGASAVITGETSPNGGPAAAKYVTKKVVLDAGNDSGDLNVYLTAYRPNNTDINVYYKVLNRYDTQTFESGSWQLMTKINSSNTSYSQSRTDLKEFVFAPGTNGVDQGYVSYTSLNGQTYTTFSQFAIKIVLTTSDNTFVPFLTDMRTIALPSTVNTTF